jgi:hypothetical protein
VWCLPGGDEENPLEAELPDRLLREGEMPEVRRVERRSEDAD